MEGAFLLVFRSTHASSIEAHPNSEVEKGVSTISLLCALVDSRGQAYRHMIKNGAVRDQIRSRSEDELLKKAISFVAEKI